jgi:hypothetical protein
MDSIKENDDVLLSDKEWLKEYILGNTDEYDSSRIYSEEELENSEYDEEENLELEEEDDEDLF